MGLLIKKCVLGEKVCCVILFISQYLGHLGNIKSMTCSMGETKNNVEAFAETWKGTASNNEISLIIDVVAFVCAYKMGSFV